MVVSHKDMNTCRGDLRTLPTDDVISAIMLQLGICAGTLMVNDIGNSKTPLIL